MQRCMRTFVLSNKGFQRLPVRHVHPMHLSSKRFWIYFSSWNRKGMPQVHRLQWKHEKFMWLCSILQFRRWSWDVLHRTSSEGWPECFIASIGVMNYFAVNYRITHSYHKKNHTNNGAFFIVYEEVYGRDLHRWLKVNLRCSRCWKKVRAEGGVREVRRSISEMCQGSIPHTSQWIMIRATRLYGTRCCFLNAKIFEHKRWRLTFLIKDQGNCRPGRYGKAASSK